MVKTFASPDNSHAAHWRERLNYWENALAQKPDSPVAWRWRIQVKVLRFMLSRYGTAPLENALPSDDGITVFNPSPQPQPARESWQISRKLWKVYNANLAKPEEYRNPVAGAPTRRKAFFRIEDSRSARRLMMAWKILKCLVLIVSLLPAMVILFWLFEATIQSSGY